MAIMTMAVGIKNLFRMDRFVIIFIAGVLKLLLDCSTWIYSWYNVKMNRKSKIFSQKYIFRIGSLKNCNLASKA